jgi:carbonic anhydrase/acetyltransferase-like protein (isoleucine patch superfamily)
MLPFWYRSWASDAMAHILSFGGRTPQIHSTAWVAPTAAIIGNVVVEEHASIWFGAVLRGDDPDHEIRVGARTSIQDNCVIHVSAQGPTLIGPEVTVGHGAILESCVVGRGALIGMNSVVLQRARVGEAALIAAGAVVGAGASIPARHLAAGTPARVKKELEGESLRWILTSAEHYVELAARYRAEHPREGR